MTNNPPRVASAPLHHKVKYGEAHRGNNAAAQAAAVRRIAERNGRENPVTVSYLPKSKRKDPSLFRLRNAKSCSVCKDRFHPRTSKDKVCQDCQAAQKR